MDDALTLILGGGKGTRLYPLTKYRSKPAVPIGGRYRLIDIPLSNCVHSGFYRVYVLTQFMSVSLTRHIGVSYSFDHLRRGFVEVIPASQSQDIDDGWFLGTADAVRKSMMHFRQHRFGDYLILSGDHLYRMDYRAMLKVHRKSRADLTVATLPVIEERIPEFGIMKVDSDYRIVDFVEKPKDPDSVSDFRIALQGTPKPSYRFLASMGIYIFRREVLQSLLTKHSGNDFGYDIVPYAIKNHHTQAFRFDGYWEDVGVVSDFFEANMRLVEDNPPFNFYDPQHPIFTRPRYVPGSIIDRTQVHQSIVCEGCVIKDAEIDQSVVGIRSTISPGSRIHNALLMGADYYDGEGYYPEMNGEAAPSLGIGPECEVTKAIIDKNARIGAGVRITEKEPGTNYDGDGYAVRNGITVVVKNAVIPDGTVI